jgi:FAD/FMN-containing dehydrogenase
MKNKYMHYSRSEAAIRAMRQLKSVFDPNAILNPYKTLPA